jgi:hypothetical protein
VSGLSIKRIGALEESVISFKKAKDPHLEARKGKKLKEMQAAFKAARTDQPGTSNPTGGSKSSRAGRSSKKKR